MFGLTLGSLGGDGSALFAPALALDFTTGTLDPRITFTRASSGTYFNSSGVLTSAANDAPRFDYNPTTLAARGLLIEEQRTNYIRNNTMQGAVAGTPGTLPTNWAGASPVAGLTRQVVGTGTQNGISYIDVRFSGTTNATSANLIFPESNTAVAAVNGQSWAGSVWISLVDGSFTNITAANLVLRFNDGAGAVLTLNNTSFLGAAATQVRYVSAAAASNASTAFVTNCITLGFASGVAIDITLRIGLPQLELGAFATSVIPTTGAQATRAADSAVMTGTNFSSWYNATEGTLFAESQTAQAYAAGVPARASIDDGTTSNRVVLRNGNNFWGTVSVSGSAVASLETVAWNANVNKQAIAFKANDFAYTTNGVAVQTDTSGAVPTVNRLAVGLTGSQNWLNGHIRRIAYYRQRLPNAQLQAITA